MGTSQRLAFAASRAARVIFRTQRVIVLERDLTASIPEPQTFIPVTFRLATPADIDRLTWEGLRYDRQRKEWARESLASGNLCLIGEHEGRIIHIGWVAFRSIVAVPNRFELGPEWAYFYDTRTDETFRGKGLQRAGIIHRMYHAIEHGARRGVNVINVTNASSIHNYRAAGFEPIAEIASRRYFRKWWVKSVPEWLPDYLAGRGQKPASAHPQPVSA